MPTPDLLDPQKEHTLLLVKPDGYARGLTGEVLRRIEAKGYVLKGLKIKKASTALLTEHYAEHREKHFFPDLLEYMSSGPLVACVVEGDRVIEGIRNLMGATNPTLAAPGTIRGDLGRDWGGSSVFNIVHGSDSPTSAEREIGLWFPELVFHD
ncbi:MULTISPECIES: nucleoside-diphosphate kinase [unclassified Schaalia]|uniref:nucleoside-diphosphate kinase n=1 Tax=unclassified Schaalia TaxID=2691889 RepID=UPI001E3A22D6|nr:MULTISPECIES: nucleoside-diphosphate kinase [unclassified Schaalia]MCD4549299.1 nucleoside-diphosphate kinase [Schaalia sp. lx-260]MCD4557108.1 nucleoside-diphosphate kinase [Schaalia sp. lx-100]